MQKIIILFFSLWFSFQTCVLANFEIKEINFGNELEVNGVISLFNDFKNESLTGVSPERMQHYVDSNDYYKKFSKIFISKTMSNPSVVTGILRCSFDDIDTLKIFTIAVHPDYRRQKIASKLLQRAEDFAQNIGKYNVIVYVYDTNQEAKQFYKNVGFEYHSRQEFNLSALYKKLEVCKQGEAVDSLDFLSLS